AAGGIRRYVRQGVLPGSSGRAGVRDDGGDPALEARRSVSPGIVMPRFASQAALALAIVAALSLFPLLVGKYEIDLVAKIFVLAIFALSLELLVGQTGLVSFGHAAFFGLGAYATALLLQDPEPRSFWLMLVASMLCAGLYALPVAALSLRTRGVYFIMVT